MRGRLTHLFGLACACVAFSASTSRARVYQRTGGLPEASDLFRRGGGKIAYASDMILNGGDARLTVGAFNRPLAEVAAELRRRLDLSDSLLQSASFGRSRISAPDGVLRLVLFSVGGDNPSLVVAIEQTAAEAEASQTPPKRHALKAVPAYPDSRPRFFAHNHDTGLSLAVADTQAAPEAVQSFFATQLSRGGWTALPPSNATRAGGVRVYSRGSDLVCTHVAPSSKRTGQTVTILHKKPGVR